MLHLRRYRPRALIGWWLATREGIDLRRNRAPRAGLSAPPTRGRGIRGPVLRAPDEPRGAPRWSGARLRRRPGRRFDGAGAARDGRLRARRGDTVHAAGAGGDAACWGGEARGREQHERSLALRVPVRAAPY